VEGGLDGEHPSELPQLYARAIAACQGRDAASLGRVVVELMGRLNFDYDEAARRLGRLYLLALQGARRGRFRQSFRIFRSLHAVATPRGSSLKAPTSNRDVRGSTEST